MPCADASQPIQWTPGGSADVTTRTVYHDAKCRPLCRLGKSGGRRLGGGEWEVLEGRQDHPVFGRMVLQKAGPNAKPENIGRLIWICTHSVWPEDAWPPCKLYFNDDWINTMRDMQASLGGALFAPCRPQHKHAANLPPPRSLR